MTASELGNDVGVAPMVVSAGGDPSERLEATAAMSRDLKRVPRDGDLFAPFVRVLGRLHLIRPFLERQHMINTLVTNLRGPSERLSFLGAPISEAIALSVVTGNVTVAFAVLSYAGTLTITIVADPDTCPDVPVLREAIARHLAELQEWVAWQNRRTAQRPFSPPQRTTAPSPSCQYVHPGGLRRSSCQRV